MDGLLFNIYKVNPITMRLDAINFFTQKSRMRDCLKQARATDNRYTPNIHFLLLHRNPEIGKFPVRCKHC